ncbi:hypothetical protein QE152_g39257 [Popillia japonica]|uniref:Endonuclease/exonuclease/phosphatase domain-containing protein n=1 Tax=Popillia japonica TaxID=7064 RepID=A0AAW1HU42_POPJA
MECLETLLHNLKTYKNQLLFITGDFHVDFKISSAEQRSVINMMGNYGMAMTVNDYTRVTNNTATIIDNVVPNISSDIYPTTSDRHYADHRYVVLKIKRIYLSTNKSIGVTDKRIYSEASKKEFAFYLANESWDDVYSGDGIEAKFSSFINILSFHYNNAFPWRRVSLPDSAYLKRLSPLSHLLMTEFMCLDHNSFWSNIIPKYLTELCIAISKLSQDGSL